MLLILRQVSRSVEPKKGLSMVGRVTGTLQEITEALEHQLSADALSFVINRMTQALSRKRMEELQRESH